MPNGKFIVEFKRYTRFGSQIKEEIYVFSGHSDKVFLQMDHWAANPELGFTLLSAKFQYANFQDCVLKSANLRRGIHFYTR